MKNLPMLASRSVLHPVHITPSPLTLTLPPGMKLVNEVLSVFVVPIELLGTPDEIFTYEVSIHFDLM